MLHTLTLTFSLLGVEASSLPIAVEVDRSLEATVSVDALRQAVGRELGAPVVAPGSTEPTRGRLEVHRVAAERARLVWRDASGRESTRELDLATDSSALQVIALLVGTLARNEVDELITDGSRTVTVAEVREAPLVEVPPPALRRFVIGIDLYVSSVALPSGSVGFILPGLEVAYRLTPWLKVGLISTTFSATDWRWAVSTAPFGEVSFRWWRLEPFAQLGVLAQVRFGAGLKTAGGCALFVSAGARIWLGDRVTLGAGARLYGVATDYLQMLSQLLPQRALILTGGLELGVSL